MGLSNFVRTHTVPSMLIAVGVLGTGYGIVSTARDLYTAGLEPWAVQLIGFIVLATGVISMLYQFHLQHEQAIASLRATPTPAAPDPSPAKAQAPIEQTRPAEKTRASSGRDLLPDSFADRFLKLMASAHTEAQVNTLLRPHKGRWMRLSGYLAQVSHNGTYLFVQVSQSPKLLSGTYSTRFPAKDEELLAGLNAGDPIEFEAQITDRGGSMKLSNAVLR